MIFFKPRYMKQVSLTEKLKKMAIKLFFGYLIIIIIKRILYSQVFSDESVTMFSSKLINCHKPRNNLVKLS